MLVVEGLTKSYRNVLAVRDVSLMVASHEIIGLLGPNGAGKTTILRCVCGIVQPTAGRILIAGGRRPAREQREVKALLTEAYAEGRTLPISTHVPSTAEELCDRILILNRRQRVAEGTLATLHLAWALAMGNMRLQQGELRRANFLKPLPIPAWPVALAHALPFAIGYGVTMVLAAGGSRSWCRGPTRGCAPLWPWRCAHYSS